MAHVTGISYGVKEKGGAKGGAPGCFLRALDFRGEFLLLSAFFVFITSDFEMLLNFPFF